VPTSNQQQGQAAGQEQPPQQHLFANRMAKCAFKWEGDLPSRPDAARYGSGINWERGGVRKPGRMLRLNLRTKKKDPGTQDLRASEHSNQTEGVGLVLQIASRTIWKSEGIRGA